MLDPEVARGEDRATGPKTRPRPGEVAVDPVDEISDEDWYAAHGAIDPTAPTAAEEAARRLEVEDRMAEYEEYLARLAEREALERDGDQDEEGG